MKDKSIKDKDIRDIRKTLIETTMTGSPDEVAQAKEALAKLDGPAQPAPALEITGPIKVGNIVVSEIYARQLLKTYGSLGDEAATEVAGRRLIDAASMSDKSKFLGIFPEEGAFYDSAAAKVREWQENTEAEILRLRAEKTAKEAAARPTVTIPEPVERQGEYPTAPVIGPAERALALKALLGK